jgi:excisionase family DNA binding protein
MYLEFTKQHGQGRPGYTASVAPDDIVWMSTQEAARRLGITPRTLYRFVDEGTLPAYKMGRVFRLKQADVDQFIEQSRIEPGTLKNLYPERKTSRTDEPET